MGLEDMTAGTDGELRESAEKIKIMYDDYNSLLPERFEFIESMKKFPTEFTRPSIQTVQ